MIREEWEEKMSNRSKKEIATIVGLLISALLVSFAYELGDFEDEYRAPNYQPNRFWSIAILSFGIPISHANG